MKIISNLLLSLILISNFIVFTQSVYASDLTDCKDVCSETYKTCKEAADGDNDAKKACRETRGTCKDQCRSIGGVTPSSSSLSSDDLINSLVPSQEILFGNESDISLAEGDIEQELAPKILKLFVKFSGILGFIIFTYIGMKLVFARSNEEEFTAAKQSLIHTFIGAVLIAASFGIVVGILRIFNAL